MSYEAFRYIFIIGLALCCVMFLVSVVLFFALNIPKLISDLSGRTAKKAIQNIREQNEKTGHKSYQVSQVNRERGKLTDKISPSGRIVSQNPSSQFGYSVETAKISGITEETSVIGNGNETSVLSQNETSVLSQNETSVLSQNETSVLSQNETSVLSQNETSVLSHNETSVLSQNETGRLFQADMPSAFVEEETVFLSENAPANEPVSYDNNQNFSSFNIEFEITYIHTHEVIDIGGV